MQVIKLKVNSIKILPDRQRQDPGDVTDLMHSIISNGLINPITVSMVDDKPVLVAGFRRLTAHKLAGIKEIHANILETATPFERELIELDENIKRKNLHWIEHVKAVARMHRLLETAYGPSWNISKTADYCGMHDSHLSRVVRVCEQIEQGDEQILACAGLKAAVSIIDRRAQRALESEAIILQETLESGNPLTTQESTEGATSDPPVPSVRPAHNDIKYHDFTKFVQDYKGPPFNLVHCDFPYGIGHDKSAQGGAARHGAYDDSEEVYWSLLDTLCSARDKIIAPSAHLMFWFSMSYYNETIEFFSKHAPDFRVDPFPLVWHKSDNRGILPDANRGPRRVYETALFITRGDRRVVSPIANGYSGPTAKDEGGHISTKPVPMLKHFFRMLVDEHSAVLDPTCGSGSALIAAEDRGAKRILGLDKSKEYVEIARANLRKSRQLRMASAALEDAE